MSDYPYSLGVYSYGATNDWLQERLGTASPSPRYGSGRGKGSWRRCNGHFYFKRIEDAQACYDTWGDKDEHFPYALFVPVEHYAEAKAFLTLRHGNRATPKRSGRWRDEKLLFYFAESADAFEFKLKFR